MKLFENNLDRAMQTSTLLQAIKQLKLRYFGRIKRHELLEKYTLEAKMVRGRPTRRWEQDIDDWLRMALTKASSMSGDRKLFRSKLQRQRPARGLTEREREVKKKKVIHPDRVKIHTVGSSSTVYICYSTTYVSRPHFKLCFCVFLSVFNTFLIGIPVAIKPFSR